MPSASVIKVTHRDHHKGASDGVEVVFDVSQNSHAKYTSGAAERPRRRAWNHPCVIVRKEQNDVWILGLTTYKGRTLEEKLAKYLLETRRRHARAVVPLASALATATAQILAREGDKRYRPLTFEQADGGGKGREVGGYVRLDTLYKMDWRDLQVFNNGNKRCLDVESIARLVGLVGWVCGFEWAKRQVKDVQTQDSTKEAPEKEVAKVAVQKEAERKAPARPKEGKQPKTAMKSSFRARTVKNGKQKLEIAAVRLRKS